jgi:hypothetical protein
MMRTHTNTPHITHHNHKNRTQRMTAACMAHGFFIVLEVEVLAAAALASLDQARSSFGAAFPNGRGRATPPTPQYQQY